MYSHIHVQKTNMNISLSAYGLDVDLNLLDTALTPRPALQLPCQAEDLPRPLTQPDMAEVDAGAFARRLGEGRGDRSHASARMPGIAPKCLVVRVGCNNFRINETYIHIYIHIYVNMHM